MTLAKDILDKYATVVLRKSGIFEKNGVSIPNRNMDEDYHKKNYSDDIVLWIPPKNCLRLEFEGSPEQNKKIIREIESGIKGIFDYCVTEHEGGKSQYINIFNIKNIPVNYMNKLAKDLLEDFILPAGAEPLLDKTNLGYTFSPVIGHEHWKKKYNGAVHKIVRGKNPLEHKNEYPKELLKQLKKSQSYFKSDVIQIKQNYPWVNSFLLDYCLNNKLPVGNRNIVIEKNLATLIIHRPDRDKIVEKYLKTQERKHNSLKGWFTKVAKGEIKQVSAGELRKYIIDNKIPFDVERKITKTPEDEEPIKKQINELKDPYLLRNLVYEIQKEGVKGEEDTILVLINIDNLRHVTNHEPTSSNLVISDLPSGGKDKVVKDTLNVLHKGKDIDLYHRTDLSEKALNYWNTNKEDDWSWDGKTLYLEDPNEDLIKGDSVRTMTSGGNKISTIIDGVLVDLDVKGKPVCIVTSFRTSLDLEGERRWNYKRTDTSDEITKKVVEGEADNFADGENKKETCNNDLRDGIKNRIKPWDAKKIILPHFDLVLKYFKSGLDSRTSIKKLIDYIKSSAVLHQHQREVDKDGKLVATWFDYDYGSFVFNLLYESGVSLNRDEQEIVEYIAKHKLNHKEAPTIQEITQNVRRGRAWIYEHKDILKERGIIKIITVSRLCGTAIKDVEAFELGEKTSNYARLPYWRTIFHDFLTIFRTYIQIDNNDFPDFLENERGVEKNFHKFEFDDVVSVFAKNEKIKNFLLHSRVYPENQENHYNLSIQQDGKSTENGRESGGKSSFISKEEKEKHCLKTLERLSESTDLEDVEYVRDVIKLVHHYVDDEDVEDVEKFANVENVENVSNVRDVSNAVNNGYSNKHKVHRPTKFKELFETKCEPRTEATEKEKMKLLEVCEKRINNGKKITRDYLSQYFSIIQVNIFIGSKLITQDENGYYEHKDLIS